MNISIVGAGIGGLASAIFLSQKGHQVTVYEQAKSPSPIGAGFLLQPPGQYVLKQLGVIEEVLVEAVPIMGLQARTITGLNLLDLSYKDLSGISRNGLGIQRNNIFNALFKKASEQSGVSFKWNSQVHKIFQELNQVRVSTQDSQQNYDLCILSSGTNSALLDEHFPKRIKNTYEWGCLWSTFTLPAGFSPNLLHQRCEQSKRMMGILPTRTLNNGYEAALYWSMRVQEMISLSSENFTDTKREMKAFWPEASDCIDALDFSNFTPALYNDVWTPNPINQRIIAIGDVCHGTSPQLGQGATMALLDALSLASYFPDDESDLPLSLEMWWQSRKYQLAYIRYISKFLTPLYQSEHMVFSWFRNLLMAPLGRLPGLYQFQLKTLASEVLLDQNLSLAKPL